MNLVYMITNKINNKKYIGKTKHSALRRWKSHIRQSRTKSNSHFMRAIRKYGENSFCIEVIIDNIETDIEASSTEIYYISLYNTYYGDGYNSTLGGDSSRQKKGERDKYSKNIIQSLFNKGYNSSNIAKILNTSCTTIEQYKSKYKMKCINEGNKKYIDIDQLKIDIYNGLSIEEIARNLNVGDQLIRKYMKINNIFIKKKARNCDIIDETLFKNLLPNYSIVDISRIMNINTSRLYKLKYKLAGINNEKRKKN